MEHSMKLSERPFEDIQEGRKSIEIRLFDEKRSKLELGDIIEFSKLPELDEKISVRIVGLLRYKTFEDLLNDFPVSVFSSHYSTKEKLLGAIYHIYSKAEEEKYGVLGIRFEVI